MYGSFCAFNFCKAAEVFAICIKEIIDSCMRAPPDVEKHTKGLFVLIASSTPLTNFSPTTPPIEPPINLNSKAATIIGIDSKEPEAMTIASFSPLAATASFTLLV